MEIDDSCLEGKRSPGHKILKAGEIIELIHSDIAFGYEVDRYRVYGILLMNIDELLITYVIGQLEIFSVHSLKKVSTYFKQLREDRERKHIYSLSIF